MLASITAVLILGGIVAKGLGVIAIIFGLGALVGVLATLWATSKVRHVRDRHR